MKERKASKSAPKIEIADVSKKKRSLSQTNADVYAQKYILFDQIGAVMALDKQCPFINWEDHHEYVLAKRDIDFA